MIKIYRKTATIKAEQFDGTTSMFMKYPLFDIGTMCEEYHSPEVYVCGSTQKLAIGDWIVTSVNGEHWPIANDVFKKTYAELPVIPKYVADWIEECKNDGISIGDMLCSERRPEKMRDWMALTPDTYNFDQQRYSEHQDIVARAWLDGYQVEGDK